VIAQVVVDLVLLKEILVDYLTTVRKFCTSIYVQKNKNIRIKYMEPSKKEKISKITVFISAHASDFLKTPINGAILVDGKYNIDEINTNIRMVSYAGKRVVYHLVLLLIIIHLQQLNL